MLQITTFSPSICPQAHETSESEVVIIQGSVPNGTALRAWIDLKCYLPHGRGQVPPCPQIVQERLNSPRPCIGVSLKELIVTTVV